MQIPGLLGRTMKYTSVTYKAKEEGVPFGFLGQEGIFLSNIADRVSVSATLGLSPPEEDSTFSLISFGLPITRSTVEESR